ncbi:archaellum component FlaF (FlaF/FlaG flagellin family) [Pedobacter sp. AK017]|uniref:FecR family protein n=1 Tax=Pedobacter sp. AK017 TaxID=2723073 RepID=UPI0016226BD8|nr:FecR family protein [Pedobacter sp. AK017]MBB5441077.1 archaellum component FlaF (FlaF/FlaG flagellin family) [Pedobacter sp. AK017]
MDKELLNRLTEKINKGTASAEELALFNAYMNSLSRADGDQDWAEQRMGGSEAVRKELWEQILPMLTETRLMKTFPWRRIAAAASVVLCLSVGGYYLLKDKTENPEVIAAKQQDFTPGSNKAILTLSNGKQILLDEAGKGKLAAEGNSVINKIGNGRVVYNDDRSLNDNAANVLNTMATPRGGQYQLTLADGTDVWLNAASSITYPATFTGKDREVEITGEVYFQVAHNADKPFRVKSNGQTVEVLGTHFNINAYDNEAAIKTTLVEGSVAVTANNQKKFLKPGQQAMLSSNTLTTKSVDINEELAWKQGYFDFTDADIKSIMRQLSRWYDVDVEFVGPVTTETFTGRISRGRNISQVLKIVEGSKYVHLTFEERRIMVRM